MVKRNFEAPHCAVWYAIKYCQGQCYPSGRDQEGHWNLGQRECLLLTITLVQEVHVVIEQQVIVSAAYAHCEFRKWSIECSKAGITVTLATRPFLIFSLISSDLAYALSSPSAQTKCSILLMEMSAKSLGFKRRWPRCVTVAKKMRGHFRRLFESITRGTVYHPQFKNMPF